MKQQTLKSSFTLRGKGLHTGLDIEITFLPAPENHGYKIQRIDLEGQPIIDAVAENVANTQRGTVLSKSNITVSTIEHAMAALYASEIDNCLIQVNAPEFPILDGSSQIYIENIARVGIANAVAERAERFAVFGVKRHGADARSAVPHPHARFVRTLAQNGSDLRRERFRAAPQRERVRFVFGKHSGKRSVRLYIIAVYGKDIISGLNAGFACRAF